MRCTQDPTALQGVGQKRSLNPIDQQMITEFWAIYGLILALDHLGPKTAVSGQQPATVRHAEPDMLTTVARNPARPNLGG
jgi:hypothetical protein